ncbi:nuclear mitotic apparatus protein 1 isoform 2-T2 [Pholidichthys leucotaenia]
MSTSLAVDALLGWVNSLKLCDLEVYIDDLKDGEILLKVVYMLKKETYSPCSNHLAEERFRCIADFVEKDCRFNSTKGTLSWENIRDGVNLTIELSKVLLLLVYYDMMNERCSFGRLESDVEQQLAYLASYFVLESEGCVYLSQNLDAHLTRKYLPVPRESLKRSASTSTTSVSTISSFSDDESPIFHRTPKIRFVAMETVASSSVSKSPLEDIMNTPKFQLRKMQRQMIKERDYRDGLERELASKISLIAQRESHISQLQYRLDKLKEEQGAEEHHTNEHIGQLETKNTELQMRFNEILKQNKDLKRTSLLMEHKVDELTDENGVLSSQMKAVCSELASFEAEVGMLKQNQASSQEEWEGRTRQLQSELSQATAQKEMLTEQIQILQGKISCLEDEISKVTKEEAGENMGPVVEKEMFESKIYQMKTELETTVSSLKSAEVEIVAKGQQLARCQQEIAQHKELLKQNQSQAEEMLHAKDEIIKELQKELNEKRMVLQQEICSLKLQLQQAEQQNAAQIDRLQHQIAACQDEIEKLTVIKKEKEYLLFQTEDNVKDLEGKLSAATSLLTNKEKQIEKLREEVNLLTDETNKKRDEIQVKEDALSKLLLEKANEQETLQDKIHTLTDQIRGLGTSLQKAEVEIHCKQDLLDKVNQENAKQMEELKQQNAKQMEVLQKQIRESQNELNSKEEQLAQLKNKASTQAELLQQETEMLNKRLTNVTHSLETVKDQLHSKEEQMAKLEQESTLQVKDLRKCIGVLEGEVNQFKQEIRSKEGEIDDLRFQTCREAEILKNEIHTLKEQTQCLTKTLKTAKDEVQAKEDLLAQKEIQITQEKDQFQSLMKTSDEEKNRLREQIHAKEEQLLALEKETSLHSNMLQQEILSLKKQLDDASNYLTKAEEKIHIQTVTLSKQEQDSTVEKKVLQQQLSAYEEELKMVENEILSKEEQMILLKTDCFKQTEALQHEIQNLKREVAAISQRLQAKEQMLVEAQQEFVQQKELLQQQLSASEAEMMEIKTLIQAKEEQMMLLKTDCTKQTEALQYEIQNLKEETNTISQRLQAKEQQLVAAQQDSDQQKELLQQQLSASEAEVMEMKKLIQAKEEQVGLLQTEASKQSGLLQQEVYSLKKEVETLCSSLKKAEEDMQSKDVMLSQQQQENSQQREELKSLHKKVQQVETLQNQISMREEEFCLKESSSENEIINLKGELESISEMLQAKEQMLLEDQKKSVEKMELIQQKLSASYSEVIEIKTLIQAKEQQMILLKTDCTKQTEALQYEVQNLKEEMDTISQRLKAKEQQLVAVQQDSDQQKELLQQQLSASEAEVMEMKKMIQAKEEQIKLIQIEASKQSGLLQQEVHSLKKEVETLCSSLKKAEEDMQSKDVMLSQQREELQSLQEKVQQVETLQNQISLREEEITLKELQTKKEITNLKGELESISKILQAKENMLLEAENSHIHQKDLVQQQLSASEAEMMEMKKLIQAKEEQMVLLKIKSSEQSGLQENEIQSLKKEVETLGSSLRKAKEDMQSKDFLLSQHQQENHQQREELQSLQEKVQQVEVLQNQISSHEKEIQKLKSKNENEIETLKGEVESISQILLAKEQMLHQTQQKSAEQINLLQQQLVSVKAELNQYNETKTSNVRLKESMQELQMTTLKEKEALVHAKELLGVRILKEEKDRLILEKKVEATVLERERLVLCNQALERENLASSKLVSVLQQEVEVMKTEKEKLLKERAKTEEIDLLKRDFQEQLAAKSEAVEHYKAQMEKATTHYNSKKQLLQESQKEVDELKGSVEVKDHEINSLIMEKKLLQLDLDKAKTNEKALLKRMASFEAQVNSNAESATGSCYFGIPSTPSGVHTRAQVKRAMSSDSLDQSSLEDSVNITRKLSASCESSTPLVRSSERLVAKRRGLQAESLETLYFTPINAKPNRNAAEKDVEVDPPFKNPTSSVKRRRTTQVINITMSKKTESYSEDEMFYSLASTRSQPNLTHPDSAQPVSMKLFNTPAEVTSGASDQLIGLPGYRRSTIHSQSSSTFCVGAENEPDGGPEDWLRIAELQARNKACPPHLKSSYPVESETGRNGGFVFTDEELRTGDPSDTIRRATMMPGQLQESLISHRHSLMPNQTGVAAGTRSHRLSLMPGQLPSRTLSSSQLKSPKTIKQSSSTLPAHHSSPEMKASCFPRPLTPRNKNQNSRPSSSHLQPALSPAERRQSMMFTIDNTPKSNSYLKKGLNKLRSSTRKSPGQSLKKSPTHPSLRNMPSGNSRVGVGHAGRVGSSKSPQVMTKGLRKSPRTASTRSAKSPGLTASARKMMQRMKV